jgi:hypothetical protein
MNVVAQKNGLNRDYYEFACSFSPVCTLGSRTLKLEQSSSMVIVSPLCIQTTNNFFMESM